MEPPVPPKAHTWLARAGFERARPFFLYCNPIPAAINTRDMQEGTTILQIQPIFVCVGIIVTLIFGWFCESFLKTSVTAKPKIGGAHEVGGGGKQLGVLERLLFFSSFLLDQYAITGGWLVFKAAGKWAAWQHVVKISEKEPEDLQQRLLLSSRLLGRFLNGTLYNALCASVGVIVAKVGSSVHDSSPPWLMFALVIFVIVLTFASLYWVDFGEDPKTHGPT
jgi:hypothetical protein